SACTYSIPDQSAVNFLQAISGRCFFSLVWALGTAGPAVSWLFGGYLVITGGASLGTVVTFATLLLPRLYGPVGSLANLQVNVVGSLALVQRVFEYLGLQLGVEVKPDAGELDRALAA